MWDCGNLGRKSNWCCESKGRHGSVEISVNVPAISGHQLCSFGQQQFQELAYIKEHGLSLLSVQIFANAAVRFVWLGLGLPRQG